MTSPGESHIGVDWNVRADPEKYVPIIAEASNPAYILGRRVRRQYACQAGLSAVVWRRVDAQGGLVIPHTSHVTHSKIEQQIGPGHPRVYASVSVKPLLHTFRVIDFSRKLSFIVDILVR